MRQVIELATACYSEKGAGSVKRVLCCLAGIILLAGCTTPSTRIVSMSLGMSPAEVMDVMGPPFAVRAAKVYEEGGIAEVWEYIPPVFSRAAFSDKYDKTYWVFFEDGKVVQWGEPGDFSGQTTTKDVPVMDYTDKKRAR